MLARISAFMLGLSVFLAVLPPETAHADSNVLFIFDASGSMKVKLENGQTRMSVAKQAMADSLRSMPADVQLGLLLYGHRRAKDCKDIELVSPIGADDAATIASTVESLTAKGETPIAASLKQAARSFAALKGQNNRVILVTDGIEECQGDPCAAAQDLKDSGLDLKVDIVGFTLNAQQRKTIECVSKTTGGQYYDAQDVKSLTSALTSVKEEVVQPVAPKAMRKPVEKVLVQLTAPEAAWEATIDGKTDNVAWLRRGQEAVYGFAGGRSATFDTFGVYIPGAGAYPKQFEILVGDEGPLGNFRSLGFCDLSNMALKNTPYQQCAFDPVTAHYVKIKLTESYAGDGDAYATEFQLNATLNPVSTAKTLKQGSDIPGATNLLSASSIQSGSSTTWEATVDGATDNVAWLRKGQEGVYGFPNGQSAEFDLFAVAINGARANVSSLELLAGDEGPLGEFRSVGICEFANTKMLQSHFQECRIPKTTAKYLKVKLISSIASDGDGYATEFKLFGKLVPGSETALPAPSAGIDLLAASNGGTYLGGPSKAWEATLDGNTANVAWLRKGQEAIYAFKDESTATFDTFAVFIGGANANPKSLELLAGNDGPTGEFRAITTCQFANLKMFQRPFQECKFAPVTAKYLKVKLTESTAGDGDAYATEFKLFGKLE